MVIKCLAVLTFSMLSFSVSAAPVNVNKASVDEVSAALAGIGEKTLKKISKDLRFKGK